MKGKNEMVDWVGTKKSREKLCNDEEGGDQTTKVP